MFAPTGSLVAFVCTPEDTTEDVAKNGRNGLFTFHLLEHIAKPNVSIEDILCDVCNGVVIDTDGGEISHRVSSFRYRNILLNTVDVDSSKLKQKKPVIQFNFLYRSCFSKGIKSWEYELASTSYGKAGE